MTIETGIENAGVYINSLDDTYPASGDDLVEGDNHIRGIKNTLLNTFPNITGAVTATHTEINKTKINTTDNNQQIDASGSTEQQLFTSGAAGLNAHSKIIAKADSGDFAFTKYGSAGIVPSLAAIENFSNHDIVFRTGTTAASRAQIRHAGGISVFTNAPATPTANTLYADSIVKAWGNVSYSGGTPSLDDGVNVSIADLGVGRVGYTFATSMANSNYSSVASSTDESHIARVVNTSSSVVDVLTYDPHTAAAGDVPQSVIVVGAQ